jgi:putative peptidoglycan lipid II flippase
LCNIIFCIIFVSGLGFAALALGTSLSIIINSFLQAFFIRRYLGLSWRFFIGLKLLKVIIAGIICFVGTWWLVETFYDYNDGLVLRALQFAGVALTGAILYGLVLLLLGEGNWLMSRIKK